MDCIHWWNQSWRPSYRNPFSSAYWWDGWGGVPVRAYDLERSYVSHLSQPSFPYWCDIIWHMVQLLYRSCRFSLVINRIAIRHFSIFGSIFLGDIHGEQYFTLGKLGGFCDCLCCGCGCYCGTHDLCELDQKQWSRSVIGINKIMPLKPQNPVIKSTCHRCGWVSIDIQNSDVLHIRDVCGRCGSEELSRHHQSILETLPTNPSALWQLLKRFR